MKNLPCCLKYAGLMGHRWIVTRMREGTEEIQTYSSSYRRAFETFFESDDSHAIYERTKRGWKRIRCVE